jgi:hypothetical protein
MAKDPVCGMEVNEETARYRSEYKGKNIISVHRAARNASMKTLKNS